MKSVFFVLLVLTLSCSNRDPSFLNLRNARTRDISVSSLSEARFVIRNNHRYLTELFRQSKDPYYNKNRWEENCLKENVLGDIQESATTLKFISLLYLDEYFQPGICVGERYHVIMVYCPDQKKVREMKIDLGDELKMIDEKAVCK